MVIYKFIVPSTMDMGSYSGIANAGYTETMRKNALWQYNNARAHDGLIELSKMPNGTKYERV